MFNSSASPRGRIAGVTSAGIPSVSLAAAGEAAAPVGAGIARDLWDQPCTVQGLEWRGEVPAVTAGKDRASKAARGQPGFALLPVERLCSSWHGRSSLPVTLRACPEQCMVVSTVRPQFPGLGQSLSCWKPSFPLNLIEVFLSQSAISL